jgi:hypothetical protein
VAGAVAGLVGWVLLGQGGLELGLVARFDPFGVDKDAAPHSWASRAYEWSFPVFAVLGALCLRKAITWLTKPSASAAGRL